MKPNEQLFRYSVNEAIQ